MLGGRMIVSILTVVLMNQGMSAADDAQAAIGRQFTQEDDESEPEWLPSDEEGEPEDECDSSDSSPVTLLSCLRTGTWAQRLAAVQWLPDALGALGDDPEVDAKTADEAIDLLIRIVHEEPDDWISRELLDELEFEDGEGVARLFRAALNSVSINLQGKAVERLILEEDPGSLRDLERVWRSVIPSWMRIGMTLALANQPLDDEARGRHAREFIELTTDEDPGMRLAAIQALGDLGDPAAAPALLRAARGESLAERARALVALGSLPITEETMTELHRAIDSDDTRVCGAAIRTLLGLDHPEAEPLLIEVLSRSTDSANLVAAAEALERSSHPRVTAALAGALARIAPASMDWAASELIQTLHNRDDAEALGVLTRLEVPGPETLQRELVDLVDYLSRDRARDDRTIITTTRCGYGLNLDDPTGSRARRVAPAPPFATVRCREAPSVAGSSWNFDRIAAGTPAVIVDYFERPDETWVRAVGDQFDCWVPMTDLAPADTPHSDHDPDRPPRLEFDLPAGEAHSPAARHLIRHGLLEILEDETDPGVVAAALTVDPLDPDQVALLQSGSAERRGALDRAIVRFRRACCGPLP